MNETAMRAMAKTYNKNQKKKLYNMNKTAMRAMAKTYNKKQKKNNCKHDIQTSNIGHMVARRWKEEHIVLGFTRRKKE